MVDVEPTPKKGRLSSKKVAAKAEARKQKKRLTLKEIAAEADARDKRDKKFAKDFARLEKGFAHFWSTRK